MYLKVNFWDKKISFEILVAWISLDIRWSFFVPKQLLEGSRSLRLFRKSKTCIIAKLHRTDSVICSHSGEEKTPSNSPVKSVDSINFVDFSSTFYYYWQDYGEWRIFRPFSLASLLKREGP